MINQPPLLDQSGSSIPGPLFTPRSGWGGRMRQWFSKNASIFVFRLIIIGALLLIGRSLWIRLPARQSSFKPLASTSPQSSGNITLVASRGDGMTNLSARALDLYLLSSDEAPRISAVEHLYAVDTLARDAGWHALEVGQVVSFSNDSIASAITSAQSLTPAQRSAWGKWLRK